MDKTTDSSKRTTKKKRKKRSEERMKRNSGQNAFPLPWVDMGGGSEKKSFHCVQLLPNATCLSYHTRMGFTWTRVYNREHRGHECPPPLPSCFSDDTKKESNGRFDEVHDTSRTASPSNSSSSSSVRSEG